MGAAKYVYGVARSGTLPQIESQPVAADGGAVHTLDEGDLTALVSDVPEGPLTGTREDVLGHSRVLEEAIAKATVLPMRFGVVMPSEKAVREELLRAYGDHLRELLAELDGRVQMRVRAFYREDAGLREVVAENPDIARLSDQLRGKPEDATYYDRIRLGEMIAQALGEKRDRDGDELVARLEREAVDVAPEPPAHEQMVLNAGFLVERERLDRFAELVEKTGRELESRIQVRAVGPLPPFSFVELPDPAHEASWA